MTECKARSGSSLSAMPLTGHVTAVVIYFLLSGGGSATYIPWNGRGGAGDVAAAPSDKSNNVGQELNLVQRRRPIFRNDAEVYRYLKGIGRQLMIWKCRNAIQTYWHHKPLPYIDLYCDVIGTMKTVAWSCRNGKIAGTGVELARTDVNRYSYTIATHYDAGQYYSAWLDFRLRIHNATRHDSGIYKFRVTSPNGDSDQRFVFVDISAPPAPPPPPPPTPARISTSGLDRNRKQLDKAERRRRRRRRRRRKKLQRLRRRDSKTTTASWLEEVALSV